MSRYIQGKKIGSGTYAMVYQGIDTETNKIIAIKKITLNEREGMPSTTLREISILKNLKHKNIIELLQVIHRDDYLLMMMEFVDYDLNTYIKNYDNIYFLVNQLIEGLSYLHSNNIVHRDLKPNNILVNTRGELKIADFGLSRSINSMDIDYSPEVITLWYRPPELLMGSTKYSFEVDIWSLGCIIYEMITKKPLLPGDTKENQFKICNSLDLNALGKELTVIYKVPDFIVKIVILSLNKNPLLRININGILKLINKI